MKVHPSTYLLLPLLALCVTAIAAAPAYAQDRNDPDRGGVSATLEITFGTAPHWVGVRGTRVQEIRERERPDYDMFRCGGRYYVYNHDGWFVSRRWRGRFLRIEERDVPRELYMVPREHWRNVPPGWQDNDGNSRGRGKAKGHDKDRGDKREDRGRDR